MKLLESLPADVLTREQEFALAATIQKTKDEDTVNDLVLHTMREGFLYAKKVCRSKIEDDELFSLCYIALRRNAKRFRPGGVRFFAFAKPGMRGALSRYWKTLDTVKNSSLHESEVEDYAPAQVFIGSDIEQDDYTSAVCFAYRDADEPTVDPDFRSIDIREKLDIVKDIAKRKLSEQERMILDLTYTSGFTFQKIGDLTNTTRSAAQLIHTKALRKIRCELMRTKRLLL
jgi:RNA polymerase sigma factor (sigma-70 family)